MTTAAAQRRRLAAFVPNVLGFSPGQRFRIEAWAGLLREAGWRVDFYPFEDARLHEVLYQPGRLATKLRGLTDCYLRHTRLVRSLPPSDLVFIYREMSLIGPAILERLVARHGTPILFDIDDPIFLPYKSPTSGWFSLLKFSRKTHALFRISDHVTAINHLLGGYAARFNPSVTVIPNFVDTDRYHPRAPGRQTSGEAVRLVWMGSRSTMPQLQALAEPLRRLQARRHAPLRVVGVGSVDLPGVDFEMRQWSAAEEVQNLQDCQVGLVPIRGDAWNRWKFFLKLVQYMAVGLPVVASRVGSNSEVVEDGVTGFLVDTAEQWHDRMDSLVANSELRRRMGEAARASAVRSYSSRALRGQVLSTFETVVARGRRGGPAAAP